MSILVAFYDLACNFSKFDSRRLCNLSFSQFQTQTLDFFDGRRIPDFQPGFENC